MTTDNFSEEPGIGGVFDAKDAYRERVLAEALRRSLLPDPDVADMWRSIGVGGPPFPKHWCGAFALSTLRTVLSSCGINWRVGFGFAEQHLPRTLSPRPGDVVIYERNWHHALVRRVTGAGLDPHEIETIDGNQGRGGAVVGPGIFAIRTRAREAAFAYYSIEKLLDAQVEADAAMAYATTNEETEA